MFFLPPSYFERLLLSGASFIQSARCEPVSPIFFVAKDSERTLLCSVADISLTASDPVHADVMWRLVLVLLSAVARST